MVDKLYADIDEALKCCDSHLNSFQKDVIEECLVKGKGGISLNMGSGKTLISLVIALRQMSIEKSVKKRPLALVVVPKSIIDSWIYEMNKFFNQTLKFQILSKNFELKSDTLFIFVTPSIIGLQYKSNDIEPLFEQKSRENLHDRNVVLNYNRPVIPFIRVKSVGPSIMFSTKFTSLIVDEAHKFTNIDTLACKGIGSVCSEHRWLLSGTLFSEPTVERILGYNIMLDSSDFPRNLPDSYKKIYSPDFKGLRSRLIYRDQTSTSSLSGVIMKNPHNIKNIKLVKNIIEHDLTHEEALLYTTMKGTLNIIKEYLSICKKEHDGDGVKKFTSYLLSMITYLRQSIVCPIIPVANIAIDMANFTIKSDLSNILHNQIKDLNLKDWLDNENSAKSSRIIKVIETINKHKKDKIVLFSCFRTSLDILKHFIKLDVKDFEIFELLPSMSITKRGIVIKAFKECKCGILLLSYEIGSEGLNLQEANTVIILDFWFNSHKTDQSVARVFRYGQLSPEVNVYMYTSNTGIEKALFNKQTDKLIVLNEVMDGPMKSSISTMKMDEIMKLIDKNENVKLVSNLYKKNLKY